MTDTPTTPRRKAMTPARVQRIKDRDGPDCALCGEPSEATDHMVPLWLQPWHAGDLEADENLWRLCSPCHNAKTKAETKARAKCKRLENERNGRPKTKAKAVKHNWPSRKLKSRGFEKRT